MDKENCFGSYFKEYSERLTNALKQVPVEDIKIFADIVSSTHKNKGHIYLIGNGGSAGNTMHIANDFIYGASKANGSGFKITALSSNSSVITCLANDEGYSEIFKLQLSTLCEPSDIVVALSGSGNSPNILRALEWARESKVKSIAILGYNGGEAKKIADCVIHTPIDDMQISEDIQLVIFHSLMQWYCKEAGL